MAIFNSLGSNYNFGFTLRSLLTGNNSQHRLELTKFLEEKYNGQAFLTYKGRDALRLALRVIDKKDEYIVGICGFTCYAVYKAVVDEGYKVAYLDIDKSLNFSFEALVEAKKKNPDMKVLIVQNTLGFPCNMQKIASFCKKKDIILIEDLAHSIGAEYSEKTEAGCVGDFNALSFSQDKMVDGVSGGALVLRNKELRTKNLEQKFQEISWGMQLQDRFYPLLTFLIRKTYGARIPFAPFNKGGWGISVGKVLHAVFKKLNLLSMPMGNLQNDIYGLPNWYCGLILLQFNNLEKDLAHRKRIASVYAKKINKDVLSSILDKQIAFSSNLRFPIFLQEREGLIAFLKSKKIFVSDIWYDAPIAPKRYLQMTDYKNQCPNAEKVSQEILNLPTHRNVSDQDAEFIVEKVNELSNTYDKNNSKINR